MIKIMKATKESRARDKKRPLKDRGTIYFDKLFKKQKAGKKYTIIMKTEGDAKTELIFYVHKEEFDLIEKILLGVTK